MKILVTGARGQVGTELVLEGERRGLEIVAAGREELDVTCEETVNRYFREHRPDIAINAAAYTAVDKAESEPYLAYAINRDGTANLARACAEIGIPLLHISTDYVFDGEKEGAYTETDTPNPQCVYGKSKLEGEHAVESIMQEYIILRVSWVFGAYGNNFVKTMLRLGRERDIIKVVDDQYGCPTWAGDIAITLLDIINRLGVEKEFSWGVYHYCGQPKTTWHGFAEKIFEEAVKLEMIGKRPEVVPSITDEYPTAARRPLNSMLDYDKLPQKMSFAVSHWRVSLSTMLQELKEAGWK